MYQSSLTLDQIAQIRFQALYLLLVCIPTVLSFQLRQNDLRFTRRQRDNLGRLHDLVAEYVHAVNQANRVKNPDALVKLDANSKQIRKTIKDLRRDLLEVLSTETVAPQISVAFMAALNSYARVRDHAQNIGEVIAGEK